MPTNKARPPVEPLVEKWSRLLHVGDWWRISGKYVGHADLMGNATTGQVRRQRQHRVAEIWILDPKLDRASAADRFDYDVEEDVIQEHLHIVFTELEALMDEAKELLPTDIGENWFKRADHENEVVINHLARVLKEVAGTSAQSKTG
ncbi:MAG: hypothetical protein AB1760_00395 [Pseudomonadota bacterium]